MANDESMANDEKDACHSEPSREWNGWEAATWAGRPKAERTGGERIKSLIVSIRNIERSLHVGRDDRGLFAPLIDPIVHSFVPQPRVLWLQHPMAFVGEIQHLRRHL